MGIRFNALPATPADRSKVSAVRLGDGFQIMRSSKACIAKSPAAKAVPRSPGGTRRSLKVLDDVGLLRNPQYYEFPYELLAKRCVPTRFF